MAVPLIDLKAQYLSLKSEFDAAIDHVLARASYINGNETSLFEREFAELCGVKETIGVGTGTDAVRMALIACNVGRHDEVIAPPLGSASAIEAVCQVGATPVLVDVENATLNLDPTRIEAAITKKTKAVIVTHMYGHPADLNNIQKVTTAHGLKLIEDGTQAHGALYHGKRTGSLSDIGSFGFDPYTNLGAFGDAGMVVTNDSEIAHRIRLMRDYRRNNRHEQIKLGITSHMDTIQAAVLRVKLFRLDGWNRRRRSIANTYRRILRNTTLVLPHEDEGVEAVHSRFVVRTSQRGHWRRALRSMGVATATHVPVPVHLQPAFRHLGGQVGDFSVAEQATREVLSIPMYPELTEDQVQLVGRCINEVESASYGQWVGSATA